MGINETEVVWRKCTRWHIWIRSKELSADSFLVSFALLAITLQADIIFE
jgi:hypothetical protein